MSFNRYDPRPTEHVWDDARRDLVERPESPGPDLWEIVVRWTITGEGEAVPSGIDVRSLADPAAPITRDLFTRLPVGRIIRSSRERIAEVADAIIELVDDGPEARRVAAAIDAAGRSPTRSDWKFRETAKAYAAAWDDPRTDRRTIARATHLRLLNSGIPEFRDISEHRVRKNIVEARKRGYLPPKTTRHPAGQPERNQPSE